MDEQSRTDGMWPYQQCDSDRRDFAARCARCDKYRTALKRINKLAEWPESPWDCEIYDITQEVLKEE